MRGELCGDTVLAEVILLDEANRPRPTDFYLIKGYAGSGKTVARDAAGNTVVVWIDGNNDGSGYAVRFHSIEVWLDGKVCLIEISFDDS